MVLGFKSRTRHMWVSSVSASPCSVIFHTRQILGDPILLCLSQYHMFLHLRVRRYEVAKKKGDYDEEAQKREQAKNALERYMHYYQRWAENDKSRVAALKAMRNVIEQKLEQLSELTATPTSQLKFLPDAWAQVGCLTHAMSCCVVMCYHVCRHCWCRQCWYFWELFTLGCVADKLGSMPACHAVVTLLHICVSFHILCLARMFFPPPCFNACTSYLICQISGCTWVQE